MERRGFFRALLGLAAVPFVPVEKIVQALTPKPTLAGWTVTYAGQCTSVPWTVDPDGFMTITIGSVEVIK